MVVIVLGPEQPEENSFYSDMDKKGRETDFSSRDVKKADKNIS